MTIRALTEGDWDAVARIYADGLATGVASFETEVPTWQAWDAKCLPAPRLVAVEHDVVLGWTAVSPTSSRHCYHGVVEHSVYVDASARRTGIGRALLEALIAQAPAHGIWTIQTSILAANGPSLALHDRCGWRVVGTRERIAQRDGVWQDSVLLEIRLPDPA